jgi:hypothetical protein
MDSNELSVHVTLHENIHLMKCYVFENVTEPENMRYLLDAKGYK